MDLSPTSGRSGTSSLWIWWVVQRFNRTQSFYGDIHNGIYQEQGDMGLSRSLTWQPFNLRIWWVSWDFEVSSSQTKLVFLFRTQVFGGSMLWIGLIDGCQRKFKLFFSGNPDFKLGLFKPCLEGSNMSNHIHFGFSASYILWFAGPKKMLNH